MKLGMVAGEPSGDLLGAGLLHALHEINAEVDASGIGGPAMINEGFLSRYSMDSLSLIGIIEPLFHLPELIKIRRNLIKEFLQHPPSVFVGIDSPDFNLGLELKLRRAHIPVVHYVSPSVWAWRKNRIHKIAKAVDLMLALFPFEADFYTEHHVPVRFVGHPLADRIPLTSDKSAARAALGLSPDKIYIAVLPGSRHAEIKHLGELFVSTAYRIWKIKPEIEFITSAANAKRDKEFQTCVQKSVPQLPIKFFVGRSHDVMAAADVVLLSSGTATLETMLFKRPMVIAYRLSRLTYQIARHVVKVPFIGLPNLLAKQKIVPEFIQDEATPDKLALALLDFINHPEKAAALEEKFTELHLLLRHNANQQAAQAVMGLV